MPHIADEHKDVVHDTKKPVKEGDLCFLFSEAALVEYNKEPRWSSIHKIRVALRNPYHTEWSHAVILKYMGNWSKMDIEAAADLAFLEFYRIVGAAYEDGMILQNGNAFKGAVIASQKDVVVQDGRVLTPLVPPDPAKRKPGRPRKECHDFEYLTCKNGETFFQCRVMNCGEIKTEFNDSGCGG